MGAFTDGVKVGLLAEGLLVGVSLVIGIVLVGAGIGIAGAMRR